jgi:hypothetical protein
MVYFPHEGDDALRVQARISSMAHKKMTPPQRDLLLELAQEFRMTISPTYGPAKGLVRDGYAVFEKVGTADVLVISDEGSERAVHERSVSPDSSAEGMRP